MDLVNVIVLVGNEVFEVHSFKLEDVKQAEEVFTQKVTANGGGDDIEYHLEEGCYRDGEFYVTITHSRVATTKDPRITDILYIKKVVNEHGDIDENFMAGNMLVYDSFDDETRKLITEISGEGVSVTNYYQEVEGETEFFNFSEIGSPLLEEIATIAGNFEADCLQTEKRISD